VRGGKRRIRRSVKFGFHPRGKADFGALDCGGYQAGIRGHSIGSEFPWGGTLRGGRAQPLSCTDR